MKKTLLITLLLSLVMLLTACNKDKNKGKDPDSDPITNDAGAVIEDDGEDADNVNSDGDTKGNSGNTKKDSKKNGSSAKSSSGKSNVKNNSGKSSADTQKNNDTTTTTKKGTTTTTKKTTTTTKSSAKSFVGDTMNYTGDDGKPKTLSSLPSNAYITAISNAYKNSGSPIGIGRLVYAKLDGHHYVFQFKNNKTWNSNTVEMVYYYGSNAASSSVNSFSSFFVDVNNRNKSYLQASQQAADKWNKKNTSENTTYKMMVAQLNKVAGSSYFQQLNNNSWK